MLIYNSKKLFIILIFDVCCLLLSVICHLPSAFAVTNKESLEWLLLQEDYPTLSVRAESLAASYPKAEYLYLSGLGYLKNSKYDEARKQWNEIVRHYPRSLERKKAEIRIGDSYFLEGKIEGALKYYLSCYKNDRKSPWRPYLLYRLGECYQKTGNNKESQWSFDQLANQYPNSPEASWVKSQLKGDSFFTVQVGAFSSNKNAYRMERLLREKGFRCYVAESQENGKPFYRVRVGRMTTHEEAERLEAQLREYGFATKIFP